MLENNRETIEMIGNDRAPRENNKKQRSSDFFNLWWHDSIEQFEIASLSFCHVILFYTYIYNK